MALYTPTGAPANKSPGSSAAIRAEFQAIAAAFNLLAPASFTGHAGQLMKVNGAETGFDFATSIDGVNIGQGGAALGTFTDVHATGALTVGGGSALQSLTAAGAAVFNGATSATAAFGMTAASTVPRMGFTHTAGSTWWIGGPAVAGDTFEVRLNNAAPSLTIDAAGNAAVATTLGVGGAILNGATGRGDVTVNGAVSSILALGVANALKGYVFHDGTNMQLANFANGTIQFGTNNVTHATLGATGNFSVGAVSNVGQIETTSSDATVAAISNGANPVRAYMQASSTLSQAVFGTLNSYPVTFAVNGAERGRFDTAGNFAVGTTTPSNPIDMVRAVNGTAYISATNSAAGNQAVAGFSAKNNTGSFAQFLLSSSTYSNYAPLPADGGLLYATGAGGLTLNAPSGLVRVVVGTGSNASMTFLATGDVVLGNADGFAVGYRGIPRNTVFGVVGQCSAISADVTVSTSSMVAGDTICIYVNSASAITLVQGAGVTLRLGGSAAVGNRTAAARGFVTLWANSSTEIICMGHVT